MEAQFSPEIRRAYTEHGYIEGELNRHADEQIIELQQWLHDSFSQQIDFADINSMRYAMKSEVVGRGARDVTSAVVMTQNATTAAAVVCVLVQYQSVCSVAGT